MKKLRYLFIFVVGLFFYSILLSSSIRNVYLSPDSGQSRLGFLAQPLKLMSETPSLINQFFKPGEYYVNNSGSADGLSYYGNKPDSLPNLLVSYKLREFEQEFELLDLNTGKTIKKWTPDNRIIYEKGYNEENPSKPDKGSDLYFMHPLMTPDSSLLVTSQLTSLIAKIDSDSQLSWIKNDRVYHHTLEPDQEGNIYVCTRPFNAGNYDFLPGDHEVYKKTLLDDHITLLETGTGRELYNRSVIDILVANGYEHLLLAKGQTISDPLHLNDVQPALNTTEYWQKGDLLISCRNLSTVFLFRPVDDKIIWLQHGPWYNQHDVDFYEDDKIVVFGNNVIREESVIDPRLTNSNLSFTPKMRHNEVYIHNFANDSTYAPYSRLLRDEAIRTITSGRCDILKNGDVYVEDTNNGRIIVGDTVSKKIEYVKRIDENHISSLFWSRIVN